MRHYFALICLSVLLLLCGLSVVYSESLDQQLATPTPDSEAQEHVIAGNDYVDQGLYYEALEEFTRAIELEPQDPYPYYSKGWVYLQLGDYHRAIDEFDATIALDHSFIDAYFFRGYTYMRLSEYEQALADFEYTLNMNPDYAPAYYGLGMIEIGYGQYQQAIAELSHSIALDPNVADAYYARGVAFFQLSQYNEAISDFDEAIRLLPTWAEAIGNRGLAYAYRGSLTNRREDYEQAIADCEYAIEIAPDVSDAIYACGLAHAIYHQYRQAIPYLDEYIEMSADRLGNLPYAYYTRGLSYYFLMQIDEAREDFVHAVELDPTFADAYRYLGDIYYNRGEYPEALENYQRYIELLGDQADVLYAGRVERLETQLSRTATSAPQ